MEINPLSVALFAIISHSENCLLFLSTVYFALQKLSSLIRSHLFPSVFISITLGDGSKRILLQFMSRSFFSMFFSKIFIVSGLTFNSLTCFDLIFMYGIGTFPNFIFLHVSVQFLCKEAIFSLFLLLLSKPVGAWVYLWGFLSCSIGIYFCFCANNILS